MVLNDASTVQWWDVVVMGDGELVVECRGGTSR